MVCRYFFTFAHPKVIRQKDNDMTIYTIRKASSDDINRIMVLAAASRQIMKESGNPTQWTDNHPSRETIEEDVESGDCYVISKRGSTTHTVITVLCDD